MPRLGLQQEQQVPISLCLVIVREGALLHLGRIFKMARNFILLQRKVALVLLRDS